MNQSVLFTVLRELGVLIEAAGAADAASPAAAPVPGENIPDHAFLAHMPLMGYEHPAYARPFVQQDLPPVYEVLPEDPGLEAVLGKTRLVLFLGAAETPTLRRCLAQPGVLLLIFENDPARLARFAEGIGPQRLAGRALVLLGEPEAFNPPVGEILTAELFNIGFPVCYALPGYAPEERMVELAELVELLFYRHRMYPLSGQANVCNVPMRPLTRGVFYDQLLHFYTNIPAYMRHPDIGPLRKAFLGETAVLVAAGPDLPNHMDYLRSVRDSAVIIAVNNALKPLVAGGVRPHFVIANDTSVHTGKSWEGLAPMRDVFMVAHCLVSLAEELFGRTFLFGTFQPELFGQRPELRLHGSVITTAFSLARHMGCARCVLVGAQLCSPDPWNLAYSRGSIHDRDTPAEPKPLTNAWPQLVPVKDLAGRRRYTTLNFLDAARWLADEIRASGLPCVSVTDETVLRGPGITYEPDCAITPTGRLDKRLARVAACKDAPRVNPAPVAALLAHERATWAETARMCAAILELETERFMPAAWQALDRFDKNNVTYLVQRFEDFVHFRFYDMALADDRSPKWREKGLRYYLDHVARMAATFAELTDRQLKWLAKRQA